MDICKINYMFHSDEKGILQKNNLTMKPPWNQPVLKSLDILLQESSFSQSIHSVYVRGSIARGTSVPYRSDVDLVCMVNGQIKQDDKLRTEQSLKKLRSLFPYVTYFDCVFYNIHSVKAYLDNPSSKRKDPLSTNVYPYYLQVYLNYLCIYGEPLVLAPFYKIDRFLQENCIMRKSIILSFLYANHDENNIRHIHLLIIKIIKLIFRQCVLLTIIKEKKFAIDIYPCYLMCVRHFPDKKKELETLLLYLVHPPDKISTIKPTVEAFLHWMYDKFNRL